MLLLLLLGGDEAGDMRPVLMLLCGEGEVRGIIPLRLLVSVLVLLLAMLFLLLLRVGETAGGTSSLRRDILVLLAAPKSLRLLLLPRGAPGGTSSLRGLPA